MPDMPDLTPLVKDFARQVADRLPDSETPEAFLTHLEHHITAAIEHSHMGFIGLGNPTYLTCSMPNNPHSYRANKNSKHCSGCNADYCSDHPLTYCVKCGNKL